MRTVTHLAVVVVAIRKIGECRSEVACLAHDLPPDAHASLRVVHSLLYLVGGDVTALH